MTIGDELRIYADRWHAMTGLVPGVNLLRRAADELDHFESDLAAAKSALGRAQADLDAAWNLSTEMATHLAALGVLLSNRGESGEAQAPPTEGGVQR